MTKTKLTFHVSNKGGVGKTWEALQLAQWGFAAGKRVHLLDADAKNRSMSLFFPNAEFLPDALDLGHKKNLDAAWLACAKNDLVVADLAAADNHSLVTWLSDGVLEIAAARGIDVVLVVPVVAGNESVVSLSDLWKDLAGQPARWVVGINDKDGPSTTYQESKIRKALLDAGVEELTFPRVADEVLLSELRKQGVTITAFCKSPEKHLAAATARDGVARAADVSSAKYERWMQKLYTQFDACKALTD